MLGVDWCGHLINIVYFRMLKKILIMPAANIFILKRTSVLQSLISDNGIACFLDAVHVGL